MVANRVSGSGNGERSGAQTLALLATPLNARILRALVESPKHQTMLRREVGLPAQTTLRSQLNRLAEIGAIEKHRRNRFPGAIDFQLTSSGEELLFVIDVVESWLGEAPSEALQTDDGAAKAAIRALTEAWSTTMLRALAACPLSLTELDRVIGPLSYPALERRLTAMRLAGQVKPCSSNGRGTPYAVTDWLRQGAAPIIAAVRWERRNQPKSTPALGRIDAEALFLLAIPLLRLPAGLSGSCRLAIELPGGGKRRLVGALVEVRDGAVSSCATDLRGKPSSWALGSVADWLGGMIEHEVDRLELGGDCRLAAALVEALHEALFEVGTPIVP